ncbi:MAG: single-stranded-DNA-specific exonuclease RecJ [Spirochaetales bacterium]|nr:single-stranded-DNA-specific exonuclease RecJ [Spirochaetales bacterium]
MKWVKSPIDGADVRALAASHDLDLLTASILTRRQMTNSSVMAFFLESDERFLHNPFLFKDMEKAVERVLVAAEEKENVLICGDKDTDGITGTVLMVEALKSVGLNPDWRVPLGDEDYGLNQEVLSEKAKDDVTLVITVDCGISDFKEIEYANSLGMDVLVFDHHVPREDGLPPAYAVVNPKADEAYPFSGLCAAAVASKFQWALCFAQTEDWGEEYCLIYGRQEGEHLIFEALRMRNLHEVARVRASTEEGMEGFERCLRFIEGHPLLIFEEQEQQRLISAFFGGAEVHAIDAAPQITAAFPALKRKSLQELGAASRMARYFPEEEGELTTFRNLMITLRYRDLKSSFEHWRRGLDLVALGTMADLMPLENENRILVRLGLSRLNMTDGIRERRPALRELLIRQRLHEGRLGTTELGWQICPLINASGRMGKANVGVQLFLDDDPARISLLADELVALNKKRRSLGEDLWEQLRPAVYQSLEDLNERMVLVADERVPRGITGILATRFQKTLDVPAVVLGINGDVTSGSIRSGATLNALTWMESMSDLFDDYGGHPQAGGFRISTRKLDVLRQRTRKWLKSATFEVEKKSAIAVDAELSHEQLSKLGSQGLEDLLERLEPYGEGFKPLTFLTRGVHVHQVDLVGKPKNNHLKLQVTFGPHRWPALWWDGAERFGVDIRLDAKVDLVYRVDRDRWRGAEARRLTVLEATLCD